jgi:hypothetical protein
MEAEMKRGAGVMMIALLLMPLQSLAVNPPQWSEFSKGEYTDTANVKADGNIVSAYVRHLVAGKQLITLYEVDCKGDLIRVHSDTPRYRTVHVEGGGTVVQSDDGFRTVVPDTRNAQIENAICGIVARREAERAKQQRQADCERARHDDEFRVILLNDQLTKDEAMCLLGLPEGTRYKECDKAGVPVGTSVVEYLHNKGIFLPCENAAAPR